MGECIAQHIEENAEDDVKSYQQKRAEDDHPDLQHAVAEEENGEEAHQSAEQEDTEQAPCGLVSALHAGNSKRTESGLFQAVSPCMEIPQRETEGEHEQDGHQQQIE